MPEIAFDNELWRTKLRSAGLRATAARLAIVRTLEEAGGAISATEVMDRLDIVGMDRVTIYRTLASLVECGLAHKLDPGDRVWRFTLRDTRSAPKHIDHHAHLHFVCESCGTITCLDSAYAELHLGDHAQHGYTIREQETVLRGKCPTCKAIAATP
jgi:Fur family ferric uptake transcriptional regulator